MKSKKFVIRFIIIFLIILLTVPMLNFLVNPFGIFSHELFRWDGNMMTLNPRIGKLEYLLREEPEIDSFIIGSSGSATFIPEKLNKYTNGKYYNMFYYGVDLKDSLDTIEYLTKSYNVKNIFLPISFLNGRAYNNQNRDVTDKLHYKITGENKFSFLKEYLFANPNYSIEKLKNYNKNNNIIKAGEDVFNPYDGTYYKEIRDIEPIRGLEEYLAKEAYQEFIPEPIENVDLKFLDENISAIKKIIEICEKENINLEIAMMPIAQWEISRFDKKDIEYFYSKLTNLTNFWDFTNTPISYDERYFYDRSHWRNTVGDMILAKIYNDESAYMPEDFGQYITKGNYKEAVDYAFSKLEIDENSYTKKLAVLMYHHISDEKNNDMIVTEEKFERDIKFLKENGYEAVSLKEVKAYIDGKGDLPEKSIIITFDDGYLSNYEIAYPILKENNFKAQIFPVGILFGADKYKNTDIEIYPHFSFLQAKEMIDSNIIEIGSHTYDFHQSEEIEGETARYGAFKLEEESEREFLDLFYKDNDLFQNQMEIYLNKKAKNFAYPLGIYTDLTAYGLNKMGYEMTFISEPGLNTLIKGLDQSILALKRNTITNERELEELFQELNF